MIETENNGDFSKWPYTVMQTLDDRIGEPRGYRMIPLEDRKQGVETDGDTDMSSVFDYWNAHPELEPIF